MCLGYFRKIADVYNRRYQMFFEELLLLYSYKKLIYILQKKKDCHIEKYVMCLFDILIIKLTNI